MLVMSSGEENRGGPPGILLLGVCVVGAFYVLETLDLFVFGCVLPRGILQESSLNELQCRVLQYSVPR